MLILIFRKSTNSYLFNFKKTYARTIDSFIGRAAHILFLESQPLLKMLVYRYDNYLT